MTIFLYRWKIKPEKQIQFEENWALVTEAIRDQCGSYGSRLHLAASGEYFAYAQWPDSATREHCQLDESVAEARRLMRDAVAVFYPDECLEVKTDLLIKDHTARVT